MRTLFEFSIEGKGAARTLRPLGGAVQADRAGDRLSFHCAALGATFRVERTS